jgi:hypothetical protein
MAHVIGPEGKLDGPTPEKVAVIFEGLKTRVIITLTPERTQLRVWNGLPAYWSSDHVDSRGENLQIHISSQNSMEVEGYLTAILGTRSARSLRKNILSNHSELYLCMVNSYSFR